MSFGNGIRHPSFWWCIKPPFCWVNSEAWLLTYTEQWMVRVVIMWDICLCITMDSWYLPQITGVGDGTKGLGYKHCLRCESLLFFIRIFPLLEPVMRIDLTTYQSCCEDWPLVSLWILSHSSKETFSGNLTYDSCLCSWQNEYLALQTHHHIPHSQ